MPASTLKQWAQKTTRMLSSNRPSARRDRSDRQLIKTRRGLSAWRCASAVFLLCIATAIASSAQTFTSLASFNTPNGSSPNFGSLVQGLDGNLYGTTAEGGKFRCSNSLGCGTVFKITPDGALTTIYAFCSQTTCPDGNTPFAGLVLATDGNFYGVTFEGGAHTNTTICHGGGCGTVFKITSSGTLTTLYSFCAQANCTDGASPLGTLVQGTDGNFYGTTYVGGKNTNCSYSYGSGCGTVFKITPTGKLTTLYSFCSQSGCPDGTLPTVLRQAANGNFFGLTAGGGVSMCGGFGGCGTVFKITPSGTLTTLYNFCSLTNCTDGANPQDLIQASNGKFYGTTAAGGNSNNAGTFFTMPASGPLTTLYTFCTAAHCADGAQPNALVQATDGNFYGTGLSGGSHGGCAPLGCGVVFKLTAVGTLTTLYSFCAQTNCADGIAANSLVQDTNGNFYGTTQKGGLNYRGTLFSLSVGLGPFVEALPTSGKVGLAVNILGTNLTGSTSVKFNGTAATFTVVSGSEIKTTVPTGGTTGFVTVTAPSGTLKSNVVFRVQK